MVCLKATVFGDSQSELALAANLPAQQAMFGNKGAALQPWTSQGLVNYTGSTPYTGDVTYTGGNPNLFNFADNNQNNQNNTGQEWIGPEGETNFQRWGESEHARMYPGHQELAAQAGFFGPMATRMNPAYREWQDNLTQHMIDTGVTPSHSSGGYSSDDWIEYRDVLTGGPTEGYGGVNIHSDLGVLDYGGGYHGK